MLIRIVRMTFKQDSIDDFIKIFHESEGMIRAFKGCTHLQLLRDIDQPNVFITQSHWEDKQCLEAYRDSEVFKSVWQKTRMLFSEKAQAFSVEKYS